MIVITVPLFRSLSFIIYFDLNDWIANTSRIVIAELMSIFGIISDRLRNENDSSKKSVIWWSKTIVITYFIKGETPKVWNEGVGFEPSSMDVKILITGARRKAANTSANVCIPAVLEKTSIIKPIANAEINKAQRGKRTGSNKINKTYIMGLI